ncbi:integrase core domain-containing protein [Entomohabitans teleogrylli]
MSLENVQEKVDNWSREYNHQIRHSSLNDITSFEFI